MSALDIIMTAIGGATAFIGIFLLLPLELFAWKRRRRQQEIIREMLERHARWVREYLGEETP